MARGKARSESFSFGIRETHRLRQDLTKPHLSMVPRSFVQAVVCGLSHALEAADFVASIRVLKRTHVIHANMHTYIYGTRQRTTKREHRRLGCY